MCVGGGGDLVSFRGQSELSLCAQPGPSNACEPHLEKTNFAYAKTKTR